MIYGDEKTINPNYDGDSEYYIPHIDSIVQSGNLYVYCMSNPIMFADYTGHIVISTAVLVGISIGALIGAGVGAYIGYQAAERVGIAESERWKFVVGYGAGGALVGAVIGGVIGYGVHAALGLVGGSFPALSATDKAIANATSEKIDHIINGSRGSDHMWYKIMNSVTWENVSEVIKDVINTGETKAIGKYSEGAITYEALKNVGNEVVKVTYTVTNEGIKLGDAWVVK